MQDKKLFPFTFVKEANNNKGFCNEKKGDLFIQVLKIMLFVTYNNQLLRVLRLTRCYTSVQS